MEVQVIKRRISPQQKKRRDHIIECTKRLIIEQGAAVAMEAVAEVSETSRSTLYRYFSSREHLISEVTLDAGYRLIDFLNAHPPAGETVGERVSNLCHQINHLAKSNSTLLASCVSNIGSEDPAVIDAQKEIEQLISGIFKSVLGDIELANEVTVNNALFRYLLGAFMLSTTGKLSFESIAQDLTELCHLLMQDIWDQTYPNQ